MPTSARVSDLQLGLLMKFFERMARGHQKALSQQKNAQKKADMAKKQGADQKGAAMASLHHKCTVCMAMIPDPKTYKQHFESKHPKSPMPPELVDVQA
ncbi:unnamed protein product [Caenorhabditis auriculariae]|uniref:Small EDRK-rich factor-like N-terminal domain-containing protein n=1 Tax=Caenorhabditis auriculariae TaxID=2777116 RepID=A0A8S1GUK0_9PELO|nr:unnamed protein product [Caenorhabditis auriculariae]